MKKPKMKSGKPKMKLPGRAIESSPRDMASDRMMMGKKPPFGKKRGKC